MSELLIGLPFAQYLAIDAISAHGLMQMERSPAHYRASLAAPRAPSAAQQLGTLTHLAILEPDEFARRVRIEPDVNRRTNAGKAELAEWQASLPDDAEIASAEQHALALAMREAVLAQPFARALLDAGRAETTLLWTDAETGVACKARPDWLPEGHAVILDLKTAADASPAAFARAAGNFKYHVQESFYLDAARAVLNADLAFLFLVVETAPPHAVALYQLDDEARRVGAIRCRRAMDRYAECRATETWAGFPIEIQPLSIPPFAL